MSVLEFEARDPALDGLDPLVGAWDTEMTHPALAGVIRGRTTFEWVRGRRFLVWRTDNPPDTVPNSVAVIGGGDTPGTWPVHYFDERGVTRVYQVRIENGLWKMWRDQPGFSQRMTGRFQDGGNTIQVNGELQKEGPFEPDLQVTYRRRSGPATGG